MRALSQRETSMVNGGGPLFPLKPILEPMDDIVISGFSPPIGQPQPLPSYPEPPDPTFGPIEPPICICIGDPSDPDRYPRR